MGELHMAKKVKVSVYGMNISKNGVDRVNLNNIFQGRSLIQIVNEYIEQNLNRYDNDHHKENLFAFSQRQLDVLLDAEGRLEGNVLSGVVKTGEYGISSELIDVNTGAVYNRSIDQADIMPFGFCIIVPAGNVNSCIVVMQNLGQYSIKLSLQKKLESIIRMADNDLFVSLGPVMPRQYIQKYFREGILQKISMIRYEIPRDETERLGVNYGVNETYEERIIHKPTGFLERKANAIAEWMNGQRAATDIVQIADYDYDNLKFVFKLGNTEKTINLDNVDRIVITEDISDRVTMLDGLPTFVTLKPIMIEIGRGYLQGMGMAYL